MIKTENKITNQSINKQTPTIQMLNTTQTIACELPHEQPTLHPPPFTHPTRTRINPKPSNIPIKPPYRIKVIGSDTIRPLVPPWVLGPQPEIWNLQSAITTRSLSRHQSLRKRSSQFVWKIVCCLFCAAYRKNIIFAL